MKIPDEGDKGSFLSPYYSSLYSNFQSVSISDRLKDKELHNVSFTDDDFVQSVIGVEIDADRTEEWFRNGIGKKLPSFSHWCHSQLLTTSEDRLQNSVRPQLAWLSSPRQADEVIEKLRGDLSTESLQESLLTFTAVVERSLGNILHTVEGPPVPALLRDIVFSDKLSSVIGRDLSTLLALLFGSPKSLNLRNLAWHGFLSPGEVPPCLVSTLIVISVGIGRVLSDRQLRPRGWFVLPTSFSSFPQGDPEVMTRTINSDANPLPQRIPFLHRAVERFDSGRYLACLGLLLSELEVLLRILFAEVNSCPYRVMTAETTEFYTTFTEMLAPTLPKEDGIEEEASNGLIEMLGVPTTELLLDLFAMPDGPRLRDKVSHGEIDFDEEEDEQVLEPWCRCLFAVFELVIHHRRGSSCKPDLRSYKSQCHPTSIVVGEIGTSVSILLRLDGFAWPDISAALDAEPPESILQGCHDVDDDDVSHFSAALRGGSSSSTMTMTAAEKVVLLRDVLPAKRLDTLFRPRTEYKLVSLLRRISVQVRLAFESVYFAVSTQSEQSEVNSLTKRQSLSYRKLVRCLPELCSMLVDILIVVAQLLINKERVKIDSPTISKALRQVLKNCENLTAFVPQNKWQECVDFQNSFKQTWKKLQGLT